MMFFSPMVLALVVLRPSPLPLVSDLIVTDVVVEVVEVLPTNLGVAAGKATGKATAVATSEGRLMCVESYAVWCFLFVGLLLMLATRRPRSDGVVVVKGTAIAA